MVPAPSRELDVMLRLASAAHAAYRRANGSPRRAEVVGMGADGSPTEELDRAAEEAILSTLGAEGVDWDVVSEEAGLVRRGGGKVLVVDPIDGSHNALRRMPSATISLALGRGTLAGVDLGVVYDLATGTTYWAEKGQGAYRDGRRISTRSYESRKELFYLNLGRHATRRAVEWAGKGRRIRSVGCASFEMTMVAQGSADGYFFENDVDERNLRVTDIAAAYRILLEAGGGVASASLAPLEEMPLALGRRTSVFAWGDAAFRDAAVKGGYL